VIGIQLIPEQNGSKLKLSD